MKELASQTQNKFSKIENWFKHARREDVKTGIMTFEVRILLFFIKKFNFIEKKSIFIRRK